MNDDSNEDIRYSLGNLLVCPDGLNGIMKNSSYDKKKDKLLESNIPYLVSFAKKYDQFNEKNIEERSDEIITRMKKIYLLSKDSIEKKYNNLDILFGLKKQLIEAFGENSVYVSALEKKGLNQFITYIYKNGSLPRSEVEEIKKMLPQSA